MALGLSIKSSSFSAPPPSAITLEQAELELASANDLLLTCSAALSRASLSDLERLSASIHQVSSKIQVLRSVKLSNPLLSDLFQVRVSTCEIQQKLQIARVQAASARLFRAQSYGVVYGRVSQYEFPDHPNARSSCVGTSAAALAHYLTPSAPNTPETVDSLVRQGIDIHARILAVQRTQQQEVLQGFENNLKTWISEIAAILTVPSSTPTPLPDFTDKTPSQLIDMLVALRRQLGVDVGEEELRGQLRDLTSSHVSHDINLATYVPTLTKVSNYTPPPEAMRSSNAAIFQHVLDVQAPQAPIGLTLTARGETIAIIMLSPTHIIFFDSHGSLPAVHSTKAYTVTFSSTRSAAEFLAKKIPIERSSADLLDKTRLQEHIFTRLARDRRLDWSDERAVAALGVEAEREAQAVIEAAEREALARNVLNFSRYKLGTPVAPPPVPLSPSLSTPSTASLAPRTSLVPPPTPVLASLLPMPSPSSLISPAKRTVPLTRPSEAEDIQAFLVHQNTSHGTQSTSSLAPRTSVILPPPSLPSPTMVLAPPPTPHPSSLVSPAKRTQSSSRSSATKDQGDPHQVQ